MLRALKLSVVPAALLLGLWFFSAGSAKAHEPVCSGFGPSGFAGHGFAPDSFPSRRVYSLGGPPYGGGHGGRVHVHPHLDVHHGHIHGGIVIHGRFGAFNIHW
jgi:hypothetical protein